MIDIGVYENIVLQENKKEDNFNFKEVPNNVDYPNVKGKEKKTTLEVLVFNQKVNKTVDNLGIQLFNFLVTVFVSPLASNRNKKEASQID